MLAFRFIRQTRGCIMSRHTMFIVMRLIMWLIIHGQTQLKSSFSEFTCHYYVLQSHCLTLTNMEALSTICTENVCYSVYMYPYNLIVAWYGCYVRHFVSSLLFSELTPISLVCSTSNLPAYSTDENQSYYCYNFCGFLL